MFKKLIIQLIAWLNSLVYEKITLDSLNKKVIEPVPGLIVGGRQYYKFANPADMPDGRFTHFLNLRQELGMGLTREDMNSYIAALRKAFLESNAVEGGKLLYMLEDTVNNCVPTETIYWLGALVYFTKDEDLSNFDADYNQRKIEGFKQLKDRGFFLTTLGRHLMPLGVQLPPDTAAYLSQAQRKLNAYRRILSGALGSGPTPTTKATS